MSDMIRIFPDTGHHYHFVPLDPTLEGRQDVADLCRADNVAWEVHPEAPWIRTRPGVLRGATKDELGYWVAIETNLGTPDRGFVYEPRTPVPPRPVPPDAGGPPTPYAFRELADVPRSPTRSLFVDVRVPDVKGGARVAGQLAIPPIQWQWENAPGKVDVDLVIDFGNTRTAALLIERFEQSRFSQVCRPLRFLPRGTAYAPFESASAVEDPCAIVDSWIVLHESMFSALEPPSPGFEPQVRTGLREQPLGFIQRLFPGNAAPRTEIVSETKLVPQMFVELSPALLGGGNGVDGARAILRDSVLEHGANFFLSSPKRYAWDGDNARQLGRPYWNVEQNRWNPSRPKDSGAPAELPRLRGPMLMFMDADGRDWDFRDGDGPPNERPVGARPHPDELPIHPRRDTLTWAALAILEAAYRQLSSPNYREAREPYLLRRLASVLVTFPSGWTAQEQTNYREQWQKAINIFTLAHLRDRRPVDEGGDRPTLISDLDEAVASQLPVLYSEGREFGGAKGYIELVGRGRGVDARLRMMNIDIGGGTTDVSIVEYQDLHEGVAVELQATLLFKNSNTIAGDSLVKRILERVLLPQLGRPLQGDARARFDQFFRAPLDEWMAREPAFSRKMSRIVHLVLVPIVHRWLKELRDSESPGTSPEEMTDASGNRMVDLNVLGELNEMTRKCFGHEILDTDRPLYSDRQEICACINDHFGPLFRSLSRLVAAFDCDLVLISGKPSELPQIQAMLQAALPLPPQRIYQAKDFPVRQWYPISSPDGKITDAKTITVVGAALRQAMVNGLIGGWQLVYRNEPALVHDNYWGRMPSGDNPSEFERELYLKPGETRQTRRIRLDTAIGRMRHLSADLLPDQVYLFRWRRGRERALKKPFVEVTLERVVEPGSFSEMLKLVKVEGTDEAGVPVKLEDVELQLRTLSDGAFWMDDPRLPVQWGE